MKGLTMRWVIVVFLGLTVSSVAYAKGLPIAVPDEVCVDDVYEDNDEQADATWIEVDQVIHAMAVGFDADVYCLTLLEDEVSILSVQGDVVVGVSWIGSTAPMATLQSTVQSGTIYTFDTNDRQTFCIAVGATDEEDCNAYQFVVSGGPAFAFSPLVPIDPTTGDCVDDAYEDNDEQADATWIDTGISINAVAVDWDADVYCLTLPENGISTLSVQGDVVVEVSWIGDTASRATLQSNTEASTTYVFDTSRETTYCLAIHTSDGDGCNMYQFLVSSAEEEIFSPVTPAAPILFAPVKETDSK